MNEKVNAILTEIIDRLYQKLVIDKNTMSVEALSLLFDAFAKSKYIHYQESSYMDKSNKLDSILNQLEMAEENRGEIV